jgi:moderate conductance mechanosensitive channel
VSTPPPAATTIDDAQKSATNAADYISQHWADWLGAGLRIVLIMAIALVLRSVVRRMITKFIERMNRSAEVAVTSALGGLLVNAERRRQRS